MALKALLRSPLLTRRLPEQEAAAKRRTCARFSRRARAAVRERRQDVAGPCSPQQERSQQHEQHQYVLRSLVAARFRIMSDIRIMRRAYNTYAFRVCCWRRWAFAQGEVRKRTLWGASKGGGGKGKALSCAIVEGRFAYFR